MFSSVFVANRGEIAVRIIRTLRRMGVRAVVGASIPDWTSLAVRTADDHVLLEGYSAADSYLDIESVVEAAKGAGCEAVHPGYGFLSERAEFAEACAKSGLVFIGPPPEVLRALGDKAAARQIALAQGVPVVPGYDGPDDLETLAAQAKEIGLPVMVKARGGGGGRGMRAVFDAQELPDTLESARREAVAAFGDPGLLLEKLVEGAHHVEVQVLGDVHGALVHLGERDCTVQRRRQKLIEETPSPVVDDALRQRLTDAALRIAGAVGYVNAGTVEFLVGEPGPDGERPFYFLEVNPRLQVEHPVTELVTGLDLVELQVRIAAGEALQFRQEDVRFEGHAIEFRVNAEDPWAEFRPSTGRIEAASIAANGRLDSGFEAGDVVPPQYDSLLAKVVVHGSDRSDAIARVVEAAGEVSFAPLVTNVALLAAIAEDAAFVAGDHSTSWTEEQLEQLLEAARATAPCVAAVAAAYMDAGSGSPFRTAPAQFHLATDDRVAAVSADSARGKEYTVRVDGERFECRVASGGRVVVAGHAIGVRGQGGHYVAQPEGSARSWHVRIAPPPALPRRAVAAAAGASVIVAPLAGTVAALHVAEGDEVAEGDLLVTLDAMKMEHRIVATASGHVARVAVAAGDVVGDGEILVELSGVT